MSIHKILPDGSFISIPHRRRTSSSRANENIPVATQEHAGLMTPEDKAILAKLNPENSQSTKTAQDFVDANARIDELQTQLQAKIGIPAAIQMAQQMQATNNQTAQSLTATNTRIDDNIKRIDANLVRINNLQDTIVPAIDARTEALETKVNSNISKLNTIESGAQVVTRERVNAHIDRVLFSTQTVVTTALDIVTLTLDPNTLYMLTAKVAARDALLGTHAVWNMTGRAWRGSTGGAQFTTGLNTKDGTTGTTIWSTTWAVSGNNLILRVTGPALLVKWAGYVEFVKV